MSLHIKNLVYGIVVASILVCIVCFATVWSSGVPLIFSIILGLVIGMSAGVAMLLWLGVCLRVREFRVARTLYRQGAPGATRYAQLHALSNATASAGFALILSAASFGAALGWISNHVYDVWLEPLVAGGIACAVVLLAANIVLSTICSRMKRQQAAKDARDA